MHPLVGYTRVVSPGAPKVYGRRNSPRYMYQQNEHEEIQAEINRKRKKEKKKFRWITI